MAAGPVFGFEGANVLFDSWIHPLMMGLEEHLLAMFRDDFEFHDGAAASHLPAGSSVPEVTDMPASPVRGALAWSIDGEQELRKIPFFVRNKARRNTELFARERGIQVITTDTLYEAKAHFGR